MLYYNNIHQVLKAFKVSFLNKKLYIESFGIEFSNLIINPRIIWKPQLLNQDFCRLSRKFRKRILKKFKLWKFLFYLKINDFKNGKIRGVDK